MAEHPSYFVDHKRGEVNELKTMLRNPAISKNPAKKREVLKKVIAYMTLGIDVSKLFSEMVMAASTKDLIQKKMVYQYLSAYAKHKADLALLAINTLQKDCKDQDPMVRGLALRSLCSLRLPHIVEYIILPIRQGLKDVNGGIRSIAVIGCAKVFRISPQAIKDTDLIDLLYNMLKDKETEVVIAVISSLNEILASEGGMAINQQIVMHLLNRIRDFNEWGQCTVLDLVSKYTPSGEEQLFEIMSHLDDRLRHSNSAVVLGTIKVYLNFTKTMPVVHLEVYKRCKAHLLTLMAGGPVERSFVVLSHIRLLVSRRPGVFDDTFKHFFLRYNDPLCVKKLKVSILTDLANTANLTEVMTELAEYATDVDQEIARAAIRGISKIAIKIGAAVDEAIDHLLSFLDLNTNYVNAEACIAIKDLLRKYPERYEEVIPALHKCLKAVDDTENEGKVAVIWMIGEYGDSINQAPYILEPLIENFKEEPSSVVRMELLSATMKLFFKRPPEVHKMLGRLLKQAIGDTTKIDVRDRGLLYYRLLKLDILEAARIVNCPKSTVDVFAEEEDVELKETIFKEFNSLSVIYNLPSEKFIRLNTKEDEEEIFEDDDEKEKKGTKPGEEKLVETSEAGVDGSVSGLVPSETSGGVETTKYEAEKDDDGDLLDFDGKASFRAGSDPFFGTTQAAETEPEPEPEPVISQPQIQLAAAAPLDAKAFQGRWAKAPGQSFTLTLSEPGIGTAKAMEPLLQGQRIMIMASGNLTTTMKYFLYAQDVKGAYFLIESLTDLSTGICKLTIKADNPTDIPLFLDYMKFTLSPILKV